MGQQKSNTNLKPCEECKVKDQLIKHLYQCLEQQRIAIEMLHNKMEKINNYATANI